MPGLAQETITRGSNLAVDATKDGRVAIGLRGDLWVVPGGGGDARQLTQNLRSGQRPRWSPDASSIAYQATVNGKHGIWLYEFADGKSTSLSEDSYMDVHPAWHPSGERIIYASNRSGDGFDLWEIDLPTGLHWRVSSFVGDETEPAWSADGKDLVYVLQRGQQWSLILRRHGAPEEVLLRSSERIAAPSWRPDGSLITYFQSGVGGGSIDMIILSEPRLVRQYATNENFSATPLSWLDRHTMVYSANGTIRKRRFDSWRSTPLNFRATAQPVLIDAVRRERPEFQWLDEPSGNLVIHASRMFDGVEVGYQKDKDILIAGGRIVDVEEHAERSGRVVIDMGDLAIIPGIIDAEARLPDGLSPSHGPDLLTMGITTVVATHSNIEQLNLLWSSKEIPGPRLLAASRWPVGPLLLPELDVTAAVVTSRSTGQTTGAALPIEFRAMQHAGLSPEQTLRSVGVNAAGAILADPYLGRIAAGAAADLIFVDGDPLSNIDDALNVVAVVRNGRFYSVSGLIDRAKSAESVD